MAFLSRAEKVVAKARLRASVPIILALSYDSFLALFDLLFQFNEIFFLPEG